MTSPWNLLRNKTSAEDIYSFQERTSFFHPKAAFTQWVTIAIGVGIVRIFDAIFPIPYSLLPTPYSLLPTPYCLINPLTLDSEFQPMWQYN